MADEFDPMYGDALPMGTRVGPAVLGGAIGQGAEGLVYLAEHDRLGRVVVKEFWPKQIASRSSSGVVRVSQPGWQEAYRRACKAFAEKGERLCELPRHPGIVRFHEVIGANGTFYLVMDQVQGIPLATLLDAGKALEPGQVRDLADALTAAAAHLHVNNLIHRDIAPDNIIVGADMAQATLIDLNAAKDEVQEGSQSIHGLVKAGYSPFEQYVGASSELDARGDIYAIASVLIHAISGARPMVPLRRIDLGPDDPDPLAGLAPGRFTPDFVAALRHGFAVRAADRPVSIAAWRFELGLDQREEAPPPAPSRSPAEWRKPVLAGLGFLALIGGGYGLRAAWNAWPVSAALVDVDETASDPAEATQSAGGTDFSESSTSLAAADPVKQASPTPELKPTTKPDRSAQEAIASDSDQLDVEDPQDRRVTILGCGGPWFVFFDWDRSSLTADAAAIVNSAAENTLSVGCQSIHVEGYVNGNSAYGRRLAGRRAQAVASQLVSQGVSQAIIHQSY